MPRPDFQEILERVELARTRRDEILTISADGDKTQRPKLSLTVESNTVHVHAEPVGAFPTEIKFAFSEWAHHLRAALDALVYQIAVADTGRNPPPDDHLLQYPIEESPKAFKKAAKRRLKHLSADSILEIEGTQPYQIPTGSKGHALWWVHDLARMDRHRSGHKFAWHLRGLRFVDVDLRTAVVEFCDKETTFLSSEEPTWLASVTPRDLSDLEPGLNMEFDTWPEIPAWFNSVVPSYRFGLLDRMANAEEITMLTTQYFARRE